VFVLLSVVIVTVPVTRCLTFLTPGRWRRAAITMGVCLVLSILYSEFMKRNLHVRIKLRLLVQGPN